MCSGGLPTHRLCKPARINPQKPVDFLPGRLLPAHLAVRSDTTRSMPCSRMKDAHASTAAASDMRAQGGGAKVRGVDEARGAGG